MTLEQLRERVSRLEAKRTVRATGDDVEERKKLLAKIAGRVSDDDRAAVMTIVGALDTSVLRGIVAGLRKGAGEDPSKDEPQTKAQRDRMDRQMGLYTPGIRHNGTRLALGVMTPSQAKAELAKRGG
jgi:hypothetical protein